MPIQGDEGLNFGQAMQNAQMNGMQLQSAQMDMKTKQATLDAMSKLGQQGGEMSPQLLDKLSMISAQGGDLATAASVENAATKMRDSIAKSAKDDFTKKTQMLDAADTWLANAKTPQEWAQGNAAFMHTYGRPSPYMDFPFDIGAKLVKEHTAQSREKIRNQYMQIMAGTAPPELEAVAAANKAKTAAAVAKAKADVKAGAAPTKVEKPTTSANVRDLSDAIKRDFNTTSDEDVRSTARDLADEADQLVKDHPGLSNHEATMRVYKKAIRDGRLMKYKMKKATASSAESEADAYLKGE